MSGAMEPLPTSADDPRLAEGWYQTIELAPGLVTRNAVYDHRPILDRVGLPESLDGLTVLDVGTADGFWAFEMERRGAARVVALDLDRLGQSDVLPRYRAQLPADWADAENYCAPRFWTAHALRGSRVEYRTGSVYDLTPETFGTFDLVYCGSLLVHLFDPLSALIAIRSVTRGTAVVEACGFDPAHDPIEAAFPDRPYAWFGSLDADGDTPGRNCMYWRFTRRALRDLLIYAGFAEVESTSQYVLTGPGGGHCPVVTAVAVAEGEPGAARQSPEAGRDGEAPWSYTRVRAEVEALQRQSMHLWAKGANSEFELQRARHDLDATREQLERALSLLTEAREACAELDRTRVSLAEARAELARVADLGPRALGLARRAQRTAQRFPAIARLARRVAALL